MTKQDIAPTMVVDPDYPEAPRGRRAGRVIGRTLFAVVAGIIVVAVIAASFVVWTIQRSFPTLSGEVAVAGLENPVAVQRDVLGIPTLTASDSGDAVKERTPQRPHMRRG